MDKKEKNQNKLILIPKTEKYIEYMLQVIIKLPRTEKFSIGTDFKQIMYSCLEDIMYISKIEIKERLYYNRNNSIQQNCRLLL